MTLQVGVKVLLRNSEGKVLILKRSEEKYGRTNGSWDIPGGRIEPGSGLIENLKREVREETGLELSSEPKLIGAQDIFPPDRHVVRLTYTATADGEVKLDTLESSDFKWLTFTELAAEADLDIYVKRLIEAEQLTETAWD